MHAMFADMKIEEVSSDEAWNNVVAADKEKDVDDIRRAVFAYAKAFPELTLVDLEATFREADFNTFLIAKEQEVSDTHTIVNFQGKPDQKYVLSFQFSARPRRVKFSEGWPTTPEENIERLAEAGVVMDGFVQKCRNCEQIGHLASACEEEKREVVSTMTCANCNDEGHRARDCQAERKSAKTGCRNCGSDEHIAKECTEPRSAVDVECKICETLGHNKSDCPNERKMKCRNCDEVGHMSRECPLPTDWSKVKCVNCDAFGHSYKRCKQPVKVDEADAEEGGAGGSGGGEAGWEDAAPASGGGGGGGWEDAAPVAESSGGGW
ncbi:hypothetical protein TI39_contig322g00007 [Zymoseptoria brevis]|uniref:CCHC-type domain-containing protein n=1 Tax=Zymoseptoria brevis TaxID=1047168 RepID=A0A0F4GWK9_9PEZI|nr:hypothetical protein TI39_contig322g00007 [Zymoseptoria brevis]